MLQFKGNYHSIKAAAWVLFIVLSVRLISFCEEEKAHARSYPQVKTQPVSNITPSGATFNGDIYSLGTEPIIEHGFVWVEGKFPDLSDDRMLLGPTVTAGAYSADIKTALAKDVEYTVKSFVKTAEHVVYGSPVTFISLGSEAPAITGFRPDSASWMDTLIISGKNFSKKATENIIKLNQTQCNVLDVSDTSIKVQVSKDLPDIKSLISVDLKGNKSTFIQDTFRLIAPRVTSIIPSEASWGDEISISGMNFEAKNLHNNISAKIGNSTAVITSRSNTNISPL